MSPIDFGSPELAPIDVVRLGLKGLAGEYLPGMTRSELGDRAVDLQDLQQQFDGIMAATFTEADRAGVPALSGSRTMAQYLAARTNCSPEIVRAHVRVGRFASSFNAIEDAMLDGRLSRQHADAIRKLENIRVCAALLRDQHFFVEWAQLLDWKAFKRACAYWLEVNDQDGVSRFARTSVSALGAETLNCQTLERFLRSLRRRKGGKGASRQARERP